MRSLRKMIVIFSLFIIFFIVIMFFRSIFRSGEYSSVQDSTNGYNVKPYCPIPTNSEVGENRLSKSSLLQYPGIQKAIDCFALSPYKKNSNIDIPRDLESHYRWILEKTREYRLLEPQLYYNYWGPWLENSWISHFCCNEPLSTFGGLIPLFVDWNGVFFSENRTSLIENLKHLLRPDVAYVTVVGRCSGMTDFIPPDCMSNILTFSGGGFGHVPIPLLMREKYQPLILEPECLISFVGTVGNAPYEMRERLVMEMESLSKKYNFKFCVYKGDNWETIMARSIFNLVPRGFGRTSFHLYETIQMGMIPVYVYFDDDLPWIPYEGTVADFSKFGFLGTSDRLEELVLELLRVDKAEVERRRNVISELRKEFFTHEGVMKRVGEFFGGETSYLNCGKHPMQPLKDEFLSPKIV